MMNAYRTADHSEEEAEVAPFAIFCEAVTYSDEPDQKNYGLEVTVKRLAAETNAVDGWASGFTEGTFFYNTEAEMKAAWKVIAKHVDDFRARSNYVLKAIDIDLLEGIGSGGVHEFNDRQHGAEYFGKRQRPALERLIRMGCISKTENVPHPRTGQPTTLYKRTNIANNKLETIRERERRSSRFFGA